MILRANPRVDISPCLLDHAPHDKELKAAFDTIRHDSLVDGNVSDMCAMSESRITELAPRLAKLRTLDANRRRRALNVYKISDGKRTMSPLTQNGKLWVL